MLCLFVCLFLLRDALFVCFQQTCPPLTSPPVVMPSHFYSQQFEAIFAKNETVVVINVASLEILLSRAVGRKARSLLQEIIFSSFGAALTFLVRAGSARNATAVVIKCCPVGDFFAKNETVAVINAL